MPITRRSFLQSASAAAAVSSLPIGEAAQPLPSVTPRKKRILMLGGTGWLGPAVVRAGLGNGHEFTLFNRGRSNPGLFPDVDKRKGQRRRPRPGSEDPAQDLSALEQGEWDAVVDTSAYFTGEVEDVCAVLGDRVGQYVMVSSLSVYPALGVDDTPIDETSKLATLADKYVQSMGENYANYGGLKRYCEDAARAAYPGGTTAVRPGYIVGPGDRSDRFSYWPKRFLRGGMCLAPGDQDNDLQFVDVRDLGAWLVHLVEQGTTGNFNAVGFDGSLDTAEFLHTGKCTVNQRCEFTWVDDAFLLEHGVSSWGEMGCWTPKAQNGHTSNARALAAGLRCRPVAETIRDTAVWVRDERGDGPWRAGMTATRERELLDAWRAR